MSDTAAVPIAQGFTRPVVEATKAEIEAVANAALDALGDFLSGTASKLKAYALAIAEAIMRGKAQNRPDLVNEVHAQALGLLEYHGLRAKKGTNAVLKAFLHGVVAVASTAAGGIPGAVASMIGGSVR